MEIELKSLKIEKRVHKELKTFCVKNELNMTVVAGEAIMDQLRKNGHKFSTKK